MYAAFKGKTVDIFNDNKQIVRRIHVGNDIAGVQVTGDGSSARIAVQLRNGKTVLYSQNGQIVRR